MNRIFRLMLRMAPALLLAGMTLAGLASTPLLEANLPPNIHELTYQPASPAVSIAVLNADPADVSLRFSDPPVILQDTMLSGTEYSRAMIEAEGSMFEPGVPDVPRVTRLVMVSNSGNVGLTVTDQSFTTLPLNHPPAPVQAPAGDDSMPLDGAVSLDADIYSSDEWYPPQIAEIVGPATLRDVRFAVLIIYPVQVNPITQEMRIYDRIDVSLENEEGVGENEISFTPESITPGFKAMYSQFVNFPGSPQLYICGENQSLMTELQKLITWRRRKGVDAYYATTTQTGTTPAQIRNYISTQYTQSNGQLEFVTIVGDPNSSAPYNTATESTQLDNYYGTMGGGTPDPVPDIGVGRLPAASLSQLGNLVAKTIQYESDPYLADTTWFTRAWCVAHTQYIPSNPSMKEYVRQIMLQHGMSTVNLDVFPAYTDVALLNTRINEGVCVFNHRMSSNIEMFSSDLSGVANGRKQPFVIAMSCGTGTFDGGSALSEDWVRIGTVATPRGAIGCVGMWGTGTWVLYNNIIDAGAMYGLYVLGIREQGLVLIEGELQLYKNYAAYGRMGQVESFSY